MQTDRQADRQTESNLSPASTEFMIAWALNIDFEEAAGVGCLNFKLLFSRATICLNSAAEQSRAIK